MADVVLLVRLLVGFGQKVCLPVGRRCGDCELGLRGLCVAADRGKVNEGRRRREGTVLREVKWEKGVKGVKAEVVKEEVGDGVAVKGEVKAEVVEGRVVKEEEERMDGARVKEMVKKEAGDGMRVKEEIGDEMEVDERKEDETVVGQPVGVPLEGLVQVKTEDVDY